MRTLVDNENKMVYIVFGLVSALIDIFDNNLTLDIVGFSVGVGTLSAILSFVIFLLFKLIQKLFYEFIDKVATEIAKKIK